jgi:nitrile hydratase
MSDNHDHDTPHSGTQPDMKLSHQAKRSLAIQELLIERGIIAEEDIQRAVSAWFENGRSPADGARVIAHAWADPEYKKRLLADPEAALAELGYRLQTEARLAVIENTDRVHHIVVCTLCSCYPSALLGPPPDWYKSFAYRSRAVSEPRSVMREFGMELPDDVEVRVVDSTAEVRYLVLPQRPPGTEGMSDEELAQLVTRDSMIGVSNPLKPEAVKA